MKTFEVDAVCEACKGTGIYSGLGEQDGIGVVCHTCKGTGCHHIIVKYKPFEARKKCKDVKHILKVNPGIMVGVGPTRGGETFKLSDFGGMPYKDWWGGNPFPPKSEMRKYTCPCWWYQCADSMKRPTWDECGLGSFSSCKHFENKEACWERWDKEFG